MSLVIAAALVAVPWALPDSLSAGFHSQGGGGRWAGAGLGPYR